MNFHSSYDRVGGAQIHPLVTTLNDLTIPIITTENKQGESFLHADFPSVMSKHPRNAFTCHVLSNNRKVP